MSDAPDAFEWLESTIKVSPPAPTAPERDADGEAKPRPPIYVCPDPDCANCKIAEAGARALCHEVGGFDYDNLIQVEKDTYKHYAREVMAAMSDAMLDSGMVKETEGAAG